MKQLLLVFLGGGAGSALRYLVVKNFDYAGAVPFGTLTVNVFGSFLIGIFLGLGIKQEVLSASSTLLLATGFCGGFTTFSAFSHENLLLLKSGDFLSLGIYITASLVLGVLAVFLGLYLVKL